MDMKILKLHLLDNVVVALENLKKNDIIAVDQDKIKLTEDIPAKHKFFIKELNEQSDIIMYGVTIGKATKKIQIANRLTTDNSRHATDKYHYRGYQSDWKPLDVSKFKDRTFLGYHRDDGRVGTANYWLFIPTVFCENRNIEVIKEALIHNLGYGKTNDYDQYVKHLMNAVGQEKSKQNSEDLIATPSTDRLFKNIDGIKFLTHQGGCGGTREDAQSLGQLLSAYIDHPNVAGASILGLGCENLQMTALLAELNKRNPGISKPILHFEQQKTGTEEELI